MSIRINNKTITESFALDLRNPSNNRIILSGKFGIGKTTFLNEFFSSLERTNYIAIHLYPINYSIAQNEDIFELIKYDILYELIKIKQNFETIDVKWYEATSFLQWEDLNKILSSFVGMIPKIGKEINPVVGAITSIGDFFKSALEGTKSIKSVVKGKQEQLAKTDIHKIIEYAMQIESTKGNIYEMDFYTNLIKSIINDLKEGGSKEVILIIDDLDRVDPEHIFRILNIFAAHFDIKKDKNKFDVDKVILSCDLNNIRNIYHHKYGASVDFSGYISKFYSHGVFEFDNRSETISILKQIISSVNFEDKPINKHLKQSSFYLGFLQFVIRELINNRTITPRELFKYSEKPYTISEKTLNHVSYKICNSDFPFTAIFEFILDIYGDFKVAESSIEKIAFDIPVKNFEKERLFGELAFQCDLPKLNLHSLDFPCLQDYTFRESSLQLNIQYEIKTEARNDDYNEVYYYSRQRNDHTNITNYIAKRLFLSAFSTYSLHRGNYDSK